MKYNDITSSTKTNKHIEVNRSIEFNYKYQ